MLTSSVGSNLSDVAILEHPSHSQPDLKWNTSTPPGSNFFIYLVLQLTNLPCPESIASNLYSLVALHQAHEMHSDVHQTPPIPRVLYYIPTASPVTPKLVVEVDQHSTRHSCLECGTRFSERKALNRHMKDRHGRQNVCPCGFSWSPARNYLFENHVRRVHGGIFPNTGNDVPL
jgi:uncharacterized Zn-finger protein